MKKIANIELWYTCSDREKAKSQIESPPHRPPVIKYF